MYVREFIRINEIRDLFFRAEKVVKDFSTGQGASYARFINDGMYSLKNEKENEYRRISEKQRPQRS